MGVLEGYFLDPGFGNGTDANQTDVPFFFFFNCCCCFWERKEEFGKAMKKIAGCEIFVKKNTGDTGSDPPSRP